MLSFWLSSGLYIDLAVEAGKRLAKTWRYETPKAIEPCMFL